MEDKDAIEILMRMRENKDLSDKEKEAISTAIGILSWTKLGKGRIDHIKKVQKAKREQNLRVNKIKRY